jgi:hypothetical protein
MLSYVHTLLSIKKREMRVPLRFAVREVSVRFKYLRVLLSLLPFSSILNPSSPS